MKTLTIFCLFLFFTSCQESNSDDAFPETKKYDDIEIDQSVFSIEKSVYVPVYSSIYTREEKSLIHLAVTLSIRNTSLKEEIVIHAVDYYDTNGKLVKSYSTKAFSLSPLATRDFVVKESDISGGTGANFIVRWKSKTAAISHPIIQTVMISTRNSLGISFVCEGREIME